MHRAIGGGHRSSKHVGTLVEHEVAATRLAELLRDFVVREVVAIEKRMISAVENQPSMLHSGGENHVAAEVPAVLNKVITRSLGETPLSRRATYFAMA